MSGSNGPGASAGAPPRRRDGLVMERLDDEVLLYDEETHRAHCLNRLAGRVWAWCDGRTPPAEMARRLEEDSRGADAAGVVELALAELEAAGLLETRAARGGEGPRDDAAAPRADPAVRSRRDALRTLLRAAGVAAALPVVESITAPLAAQAASCITLGDCATADPNPPTSCTGLPICEDRTQCCRKQGQTCAVRRC